MFVHFPRALLLGGVVVEVIGWAKRSVSLRKAGLVLLTAGVLMALPAVATGLLAYGRVDHSEAAHAIMTTHRNLMLVGVGLFAAAVAWHWRGGDRPIRQPWSALYAVLLAAATAVLVVGSDRGADLVFGHAIGVPSSRLEAVLLERQAEHGHRNEASGDPGTERGAASAGDEAGAGNKPADPESQADTALPQDDSLRLAHEH